MMAGMLIVTFGGKACLDPQRLREECETVGLPTDWWGSANRGEVQARYSRSCG